MIHEVFYIGITVNHGEDSLCDVGYKFLNRPNFFIEFLSTKLSLSALLDTIFVTRITVGV